VRAGVDAGGGGDVYRPHGAVEDGRVDGRGLTEDPSRSAVAILEPVQSPRPPSCRDLAWLTIGRSLVSLNKAEPGVGMRATKAVGSGQIGFRVPVTGQPSDTGEPGEWAFPTAATTRPQRRAEEWQERLGKIVPTEIACFCLRPVSHHPHGAGRQWLARRGLGSPLKRSL
jgi:hypothetical protein